MCSRKFGSKSARKQHQRDVHGQQQGCSDAHRNAPKERTRRNRTGSRDITTLDPPIENLPGQWVPREDFTGQKSFGFFECPRCSYRSWFSAHSFANFRQGCQGCEKKHLPLYLWENDHRRCHDEHKKESADSDPHDAKRCEACRHGVCSGARASPSGWARWLA